MKIVIADANRDSADSRAMLEAGFDRHLTKPVDPAALEAALQVAPGSPPA